MRTKRDFEARLEERDDVGNGGSDQCVVQPARHDDIRLRRVCHFLQSCIDSWVSYSSNGEGAIRLSLTVMARLY